MARYGQGFKDRAVARLLPPASASIQAVSLQVGVAAATFERWRSDALSKLARERRAWTAAARFDAALPAAAMDEPTKGTRCRERKACIRTGTVIIDFPEFC